jgi:Tol biopolymer transport system component
VPCAGVRRAPPTAASGRAGPPGRALAAALALAGGLLLAGCRGEARPVPVPAAAAGSDGSAFELLFERELDGNMDLFVVPAGGGPERRLTDHPKGDGLGRWTPDGKAVVFGSERTGEWQLYEVDAAGGAPRRLRTTNAREFQSDPSPDGKSIAFLSYLDGPERLWVMERATGAARPLVKHGDDTILGNPHWSPDGRLITFSSNHRLGHQIYTVDVATGEEKRVSGITSGGCEPRFSRDGRKIVYVSRGHLRKTSSLVEHDLASGTERTLVSWPALNYDPVYSPDGTELAFASNISGRWAVYRQRLSDGKAWQVTFGPGDARSPDYRPVTPR